MFYDLIIIGGGPAAIAAAVYAARKLFNIIILTRDLNGAFEISQEIKNFIGIPSINGEGLMRMLKSHLKSYEGPNLKVLTNKSVEKILQIEGGFEVKTEAADIYKSKFVLIATGRSQKKLDVAGTKEFEGKGIFYCVECDAPLMMDKDVAIIGSGTGGLRAAKTLLFYAKTIYILGKNEKVKGEELLRQELESSGKIVFILNADVVKFGTKGYVIAGQKILEELTYKDLKDGKEKKIDVSGVFVKIGSRANSQMANDLVKLTESGDIIVDPSNLRTSLAGIWAAGDVTNYPYRQINIAIGDAIKAVMDMGNLKQGKAI